MELLEVFILVLKKILDFMNSKGCKVYFGCWLIEGGFLVVFLDVGVLVWVLECWKGEFWDICNIGVLWYDCEVNDVVFFGFFIIWFLGEFFV